MTYPWSKFFWSDWEADQGLRLCSLAAQGLWMRILCVCARHEPKGYLAINGNPLAVDAIARLAGVAETEVETLLAELERNGVFSRNRAGCVYSRRMVRDEKRSQEGRKHKKRGLSQSTENTEENPEPSREATRGPSPHIPEARSQKESLERNRFEEFWQTYPHRGGAKRNRKGAEVKFAAAVRRGIPQQTLIDAATRYRTDKRVLDGYSRDPVTWLNQNGWEDDVEAAQAKPEAGMTKWEYIAKHGSSAGWAA